MRGTLAIKPILSILTFAVLFSILFDTNMSYASAPSDGTNTTDPRISPSNAKITSANITNAYIASSNITDSNVTNSRITNSSIVPPSEPENTIRGGTRDAESDDKTPEEPEPQDAILQIQIEIVNMCRPQILCSNINPNSVFGIKVFSIGPGYSEFIDPTITVKEDLSYAVYPLEKNEIVKYLVTPPKQNSVLLPWHVVDTQKQGDCDSSLAANQIKTCNIKFTVKDKPMEDFGIGYLHVKNNITNNCHPTNICNGLRSSTVFADHISTLKGTSYEEELMIPGSEAGWTIPFFMPHNESLVQYNVEQSWIKNKDVRYTPSEVIYATDCQGIIGVGDNRFCTISSTFGQGNLNVAKLKIITQIETNEICETTGSCTNMRADEYFSNHIYTFNYNEYDEEFEFPASEAGWIVDFFPSRDGGGFIQYDVKQTLNDQNGYHKSGSWNVTYSAGCHGFMQAGDNKTCTIKNFWIKHPITPQLLSDSE